MLEIAEYAAEESAMMFKTAVALVPVVMLVMAVRSVAVILTAPLRPCTVVTFAEIVPLLTPRPPPTATAPAAVAVARGSRALAIVPVLIALAS